MLHDTPGHDDALTYQVSLRNVQWFRRYYLDKYSQRIWTLNVTMTLRTAIKTCYTTLWHVMVYYYTKSGCKRFRSSGDMEKKKRIWPPYCDLDLDDRNPTFSHDTPDHDDAQPCQVSRRKVKWFRRYRPDKIFPEDLDRHCDLDLENSNLKLLHNILACDDAPLY